MRFRAFATPAIVAAICIPIVAAMGLAGTFGAGLGMAVGALAATTIFVSAARLRPERTLEVASSTDAQRRVVVIALEEPSPHAAEQIARLAGKSADVRLLVPVPSARLDRWMSSEDKARREAEARLARSAGTLVAAGLPVSGSVGDPDPAQALEDELHGFPADEVILLGGDGRDPLAKETRLGIPLRRVAAD
jgi:hypothetical protein